MYNFVCHINYHYVYFQTYFYSLYFTLRAMPNYSFVRHIANPSKRSCYSNSRSVRIEKPLDQPA